MSFIFPDTLYEVYLLGNIYNCIMLYRNWHPLLYLYGPTSKKITKHLIINNIVVEH